MNRDIHDRLMAAQFELAGPELDEDRIDFLSSYGNALEDVLRETTLSEHELAFVLVSIAYHLLDQPRRVNEAQNRDLLGLQDKLTSNGSGLE